MKHLQPFESREVLSLPEACCDGWELKRYAILADGKQYDSTVDAAALAEACVRLPEAGALTSGTGNHGIGFQLVHFAEVAVVSPVFYWQWGSVLASVKQMRASWESPTEFKDGVEEVVGCIWEMEIVGFEVDAWKNTLLRDNADLPERIKSYIAKKFAQ